MTVAKKCVTFTCSSYFAFCTYMGMSGPSLPIESTDCMILYHNNIRKIMTQNVVDDVHKKIIIIKA